MNNITIDNVEVHGILSSIRGMRNSWNSWDKSDSYCVSENAVNIGPNDLKLMKKLIKAGSEHRKFLRQIMCWFDIKAALYFYSEFDTYKIGTARNSCSTMHTLTKNKLTKSDFIGKIIDIDLEYLNSLMTCYKEKKDIEYFYELKSMLPSGYLQKSTICCNYEVLMNMYHQRKNHRLKEWKEFCSWAETLPYMSDFLDSCK